MKKHWVKFWANAHWIYDYHFHEYLFGPFKEAEYQAYMWDKWGDRYSAKYIENVYNENQ